MDLAEVEFDLGLSEDGVWVDIGGGTKVKVRRFGGSKATAAMRRITKPHSRQLNVPGGASPELVEKLTVDHLADAIVLGWEGLKYNGEPVPYSKEKAKELFSDPRFDQFRVIVEQLSREVETFRKEFVQDVVGKS